LQFLLCLFSDRSVSILEEKEEKREVNGSLSLELKDSSGGAERFYSLQSTLEPPKCLGEKEKERATITVKE
jgi:hypothetical protein